MERPLVLAMSSQVAHGSVGLRAAAFALERRGHPVAIVPTVFLPWHPGHGPAPRTVPPDAAFAASLGAIAGAPWADTIAAVLTGYFATAGQVAAVARFLDALAARALRPLVQCDPVSGDGRGPYVPAEVIDALGAELLPRADVATPNLFELALLTGRPVEEVSGEADGLVAAARALGPATVVVTSATTGAREAGTTGALLVETGADAALKEVRHEALSPAPHGTGDLFGAVFLSSRLTGAPPARALSEAASATLGLVKAAVAEGATELPIARAQHLIAAPVDRVELRPLGAAVP